MGTHPRSAGCHVTYTGGLRAGWRLAARRGTADIVGDAGVLRQEFDEWFPGSKFVLTVRQNLTSILDSEMGRKLRGVKPATYRQLFGEELGAGHREARAERHSLDSLVRACKRITDPKRLNRAKKFIQDALVWGILTRRRYAVSRSPRRRVDCVAITAVASSRDSIGKRQAQRSEEGWGSGRQLMRWDMVDDLPWSDMNSTTRQCASTLPTARTTC
jgi:hypothetical protein